MEAIGASAVLLLLGLMPPPLSPAVLEVHQFAQEAVVADAWLTAQEPLLKSRELGNSVDEVEQLIRRHEAFRKAASAWEERFSSLRRLTTVGRAARAQGEGRGRCAPVCLGQGSGWMGPWPAGWLAGSRALSRPSDPSNLQIEKLKAEQSKQPPTPLLGRKIFADPTELNAKRQPLYEKDPLRGRLEAPALINGAKPEALEQVEAKVAYVRQELKPERLQPKMDRLQEGRGAVAEAKVLEKAGALRAAMEEEAVKPERLPPAARASAEQVEAKGSRGEAQAERQRERHERRLERQHSTEQDGPRPEQTERRRERRERKLERQESSEQETPRRERQEKRLERQGSSEQEGPRNDPKAGG